MSDDYEDYDDDHPCPCGCQDDPDRCVYASTCNTCGKKYLGRGYGAKGYPCYECERKAVGNDIKTLTSALDQLDYAGMQEQIARLTAENEALRDERDLLRSGIESALAWERAMIARALQGTAIRNFRLCVADLRAAGYLAGEEVGA